MIQIICTAVSCTLLFGVAIWVGRISAKYDLERRVDVLEKELEDIEKELEIERNNKRRKE